MPDLSRIRNFAIIAHIDHGKSTLADRMIERAAALPEREMRGQVLDTMDIERERGITIKAQTVRLRYIYHDKREYFLNLVDTPGHVDFSYEVSRSLAACEGSLLLVDASQGVEAQTLANAYQAIDNGHEIVPVLNKIDLPASEPDRIRQQIDTVLGLDGSAALEISAKTGLGIDDLFRAVIERLPPPAGILDAPLRALLIDSWYDPFLGVVMLVRVIDGIIHKGQQIRFLSDGMVQTVEGLGVFTPKRLATDQLGPGEIGFLTAAIKRVIDRRIGDTITGNDQRASVALPGFKPFLPVVFCGLYPEDTAEYSRLRDRLEKLALNDSSFVFEPESSAALGLGFRCGFLGLLHLEITRERVEREFDLSLITTAPNVVYRLSYADGTVQTLRSPADMPDPSRIDHVQEPWILATIMTPEIHLGQVITLCEERRGKQKEMSVIDGRAMLHYRLPLNEVVYDFHDRLKAISRGFASYDYTLDGFERGDLLKLTIMVNGEIIESLSSIVPRERAEQRGRIICQKLKENMPRQLFRIAIQAALGGRVIARETISAMRKDVTAKCYGGDITRKRKLLEKQKEGKKKMRQIGRVNIPSQALISILKQY